MEKELQELRRIVDELRRVVETLRPQYYPMVPPLSPFLQTYQCSFCKQWVNQNGYHQCYNQTPIYGNGTLFLSRLTSESNSDTLGLDVH